MQETFYSFSYELKSNITVLRQGSFDKPLKKKNWFWYAIKERELFLICH